MQLQEIINDLYADNGRKIRRMCNKGIRRFSSISQKDYDDFYSAANEACTLAMGSYEEGKGTFEGYLYKSIQFAIIDEVKKRSRYKRRADQMAVSLDAPVSGEESMTLSDLLAGNFDLEKEIFGEESRKHQKVEQYLARLSSHQRKILVLLAHSYQAVEIQGLLHLTQKEYSNELEIIRSYENIKILL